MSVSGSSLLLQAVPSAVCQDSPPSAHLHFIWNTEFQRALKELKKLTSAPVSSSSHFDRSFTLETLDASAQCLGAILLQTQEHGTPSSFCQLFPQSACKNCSISDYLYRNMLLCSWRWSLGLPISLGSGRQGCTAKKYERSRSYTVLGERVEMLTCCEEVHIVSHQFWPLQRRFRSAMPTSTSRASPIRNQNRGRTLSWS